MGTVLGTLVVVRVKSATARWLDTCFVGPRALMCLGPYPPSRDPTAEPFGVERQCRVRPRHVAAREWLVCPGGALRCAEGEDATQPRTVDKARRRIVEAMHMSVHDGRRARMVDDVKLPSGALRTYATLRKSADEEERCAA